MEVEQVILEGISRCMKDKNMTGSAEHELKHGKSYLTHLVSFYDEMTSYVDAGRWTDLPGLGGCDQQH